MTSANGVATTVIEANGLRFTADVAGPDDGAAVLLLHGFPQTRHTWRAELAALAAAGYRACAPDQRGYSEGARPGGIADYRVELLMADALGIADSLAADRFHIVGHDWGGALAWFIAAHHAERVISLSVISRPHPAAFMAAMRDDPDQPHRSRHHPAFQRPEATDALLVDNAGALRRAMARNAVPDADIDAYLAALSSHEALDAAVNWYRAMGQSRIQSSSTPAIDVPTMFVWGNEDVTVGRMAAENTADYVTGPYQFAELPGVNHFVTDEAPGVFTELLLAHLAQYG
ncbi:MAG: alpha/beta hydrolase [Acidimicrobiaceae bacterium]|nr:alpha/beta hydrolase [Acidimicrobiaceae bacterium]